MKNMDLVYDIINEAGIIAEKLLRHVDDVPETYSDICTKAYFGCEGAKCPLVFNYMCSTDAKQECGYFD
ncbi:MAG: hypothetical protein ABIH72_02985 [archaeon]